MMNLISVLRDRLGEQGVRVNEPMARHNTFRIGGPADVFAMPSNTDELVFVLRTCRDADVPCFVLGNGSNLLVRDGGIRGVTLSMARMTEMTLEGDKITAQGGAMLPVLSKFALKHSLSGLEFAEGIPGSVGGSVAMNAGAYGSEISDIFCHATLIDAQNQTITLSNADMAFSYRKSTAQAAGMVVAEAVFALNPAENTEIAALMADLRAQRISKQPLDKPSAGSTFKRPPGKFAGKLIMDAGLRGFAIGGAQVSEKHCGFIVNKGGATANDVLALMEHVVRVVREKFSITLEPEVKIVGE